MSTRSYSIKCYHCGDDCRNGIIQRDGHDFCCDGCSTVYQILNDNQLCDYYSLEDSPGRTPEYFYNGKWAFLDNVPLTKSLYRFRNEDLAIVNLHIPSLHCTSCIYLLENLQRLNHGILSSEVNFLRKEVLIRFNPAQTGLRKMVEILCRIGYAPNISLAQLENRDPKTQTADRRLIYKIGIAGFCFGNIMMLSLPEYFDSSGTLSAHLKILFRTLNGLLIVPVIFYSAEGFFRSAWSSIRARTINMDVPIVIGIIGFVVQSYLDLFRGAGSGFFDSVSGFVFMLLLGRYFQQRTQQALEFDRDYKSYFPLAVTRLKTSPEKIRESINVTQLKKDDIIEIHHQELIPADSLLESDEAELDYSFVTGESRTITSRFDEEVYAGARNAGKKIRLRVLNEVSQSYLTKLWNTGNQEQQKSTEGKVWSNRLALIFTIVVLALALITGVYWQWVNPAITLRAVCAVLIVACPCVLALSIPFTFGAVLRIFGKHGLYLKNGEAVESLARANTIVFDKTGTLTEKGNPQISYHGEGLTIEEQRILEGITAPTIHPASKAIREDWIIPDARINNESVSEWKERIGEGIEAKIEGRNVRLGKLSFAAAQPETLNLKLETPSGTYISFDGKIKGRFETSYNLRPGIDKIIHSFREKYRLRVLSGDDDRDRQKLSSYFHADELLFWQKPDDKLNYIAKEQSGGKLVMFVGDGLNDAAALRQSNFGIALTEDANAFTPAADAILDAGSLGLLPRFAAMARATKLIIYGAVIFSLAYNVVGLSFAIRGDLQPWVAAILMPLSSATVLVYTQLSTRLTAKLLRL